MKIFFASAFLLSLSLNASIESKDIDIQSIKNAERNLSKEDAKLRKDVQNNMARDGALEKMKKFYPLQAKTKELSRALHRLEEVERNYGELGNPALLKQTRDHINRVKEQFIKLLEEYFKDERDIEHFLK